MWRDNRRLFEKYGDLSFNMVIVVITALVVDYFTKELARENIEMVIIGILCAFIFLILGVLLYKKGGL